METTWKGDDRVAFMKNQEGLKRAGSETAKGKCVTEEQLLLIILTLLVNKEISAICWEAHHWDGSFIKNCFDPLEGLN